MVDVIVPGTGGVVEVINTSPTTATIDITTTGPRGPTGVAGPPGFSTDVLPYTFSVTTSVPPASGEVRLNNANQTAATAIRASYTTASGFGVHGVLLVLDAGDYVGIQSTTDVNGVERYLVTGPVVQQSGYMDIPVSWQSGGLTLVDRESVQLITVRVGPQGPKGDTGNTGAGSVVPGPQGPAGPQGANSTVPGPQGAKGDKGDPGLNAVESYVDLGNKTGALVVDYNAGRWQKMTLTGNVTSMTINNAPAAPLVSTLCLLVQQDATGARTITWPVGTKWPQAGVPMISTQANWIDLVQLFTINGVWYGIIGGWGYQ